METQENTTSKAPVMIFLNDAPAIDIDEELNDRCIVLNRRLKTAKQTRAIHDQQRENEPLDGLPRSASVVANSASCIKLATLCFVFLSRRQSVRKKNFASIRTTRPRRRDHMK